MRNKLVTIFLNLIVGNIILYIIEKGKNHTEIDYTFFISFSSSAIIILMLALQLIKKKTSLLKTSLLALLVSFFVPVLGWVMAAFFATGIDFETFIKNLFLASIVGVISLKISFPITILNVILFAWLSKTATQKI